MSRRPFRTTIAVLVIAFILTLTFPVPASAHPGTDQAPTRIVERTMEAPSGFRQLMSRLWLALLDLSAYEGAAILQDG